MHNFYATDSNNIVNFEIGNKIATCGPAATNTSKVKATLINIGSLINQNFVKCDL